MRVDDFDFELPTERIAQAPVSPRDAAKLLHVASGRWRDRSIRDLPGLLDPGDLLVVNDTKVLPARLTGRRGEAKVEVTLHKADAPDIWRAFARPARKLKLGHTIDFAPGFSAEVAGKGDGGEVVLRFNREGADLIAALHEHGIMPLPPYIKRPAAGDAADRDDYQTLFAAREGAVAAPTASLHFTEDLLHAIEARGVAIARLTLHVGAGTFLPVKVDDTEDHVMHAEWGELSPDTAAAVNRVKASGRKIVAAGTTALRLLESAATDDGRVEAFTGDTDLFITPGFRFRIVDKLLTNFHLPKSTLFMLVSAFAGLEVMKAAYAHAVDEGYRFFSYGDATLLERADHPGKGSP